MFLMFIGHSTDEKQNKLRLKAGHKPVMTYETKSAKYSYDPLFNDIIEDWKDEPHHRFGYRPDSAKYNYLVNYVTMGCMIQKMFGKDATIRSHKKQFKDIVNALC